ncbi:hypothetical protein [Halococcus saccharolyticus]|uniref:Uncharacterized protein n=1 Tax=Halococcus saccharolyticus DSM 5350 TaxID=1227455 RepID=M0MBB3_9EURY|nr:hypothetical protein [Halococcus saccharolyticus]EMA42638.1 hypothetical protein C449_15888 [Halococcus saccharolyticus DSM 5350]
MSLATGTDQPALPTVIGNVLSDARPGGLDRQVLVERVAEISGATMDDVEEVLQGELERGAVYRLDSEIKRTPSGGKGFGGDSR